MKRSYLLSFATLAALAVPTLALAANATAPATVTVDVSGQGAASSGFDAVVEAVRQSTISTQVAGAVVALHVKAGDTVRAGHALVQIDARAAEQQVAGSSAQVEAAQAALNVATKELERQKQLLQKNYISQAALDRAQAQWQAAQAQVKALQAQTRAAQTQSGFFVVLAPYAGVVSDVPVTLGDMAMPGRPLITMYDPAALRITAHVPQSVLASFNAYKAPVRFEVPGVAEFSSPQAAAQTQLLPTVDPVTHTVQLRVALPKNTITLQPGMFARVWLPGSADATQARMVLPLASVVRRGEMTGVYVLDAQGQPRLRQVRLGRTSADRVEVLSGLRAEDKVLAQPLAATVAR
jgi:RND family efflux transporter MFP subunit